MKKIIFIISVLVFVFGSCSNAPKNDAVPPTITDIRFNVDNKIAYLVDSVANKYDTIIINPKNKSANLLDTLVLGGNVTINGLLTSTNGLTNMKVMIYGDTLSINPTDTCINLSEVPRTSFFGKTEFTMSNLNVTSSLPLEVQSSSGRKLVREGDEYRFDVYCIDRLGNVNSQSYHQKPIVILSVDSILKIRKKII